MSEFISTCPKCAQQILCDTAYVGRRIACPKCLQVIQMPEPGQGSGPVAGSQAAAAGAGGKGGNTMVLAAIGGVVVIVVAVAAVLVLRKPAAAAPSTPAATASVPTAAPAPAATATAASAPRPTPAVQTKRAIRPPVMPAELLAKCRAVWTFDQDSGDTVLDATGNGYNGKLKGDTAVWVKAESSDSSGLRMDGADCVEVAAPVVNTAESFTVTAWVKLDVMEAKKPQTIVSIDGATNSGFDLGYFPYTSVGTNVGGRFELLRPTSDSKDATAIRALTLHGVYTKNWYHLAGVYDAREQTIGLYLNGDLQTNVPAPGVWQATGKTAIGRGTWAAGRPGRYFQGIIRDVRLFSAALTADQIKQIAH